MAFSCGRIRTLLSCDHVIYPADNFKTGHLCYHNRDAFLPSLIQSIGSRLATLNQDDSGMAQQVAYISSQNLIGEPFFTGDNL